MTLSRSRILAGVLLALVALVCACVNRTPADAQPPTQSIFGSAPIAGTFNDSKSVELGVKFTVSQAASATGARFYKPAGMTGVHKGYLYAGAALKASVTFTNETPSGWQEASFTTAVPLVPGTIYTVSYLSPKGVHADTDPFKWPVTSGVITATTGVYKLSAGGTVPTSTAAENYGADVIVSTGVPTTTPTPPPTTTTVAPPSTTTTVPPTTDPTTPPPPTTTAPPTTTTPPPAGCPVPTPNVPDGPDPWGGCFPGPLTAGVPASVTLTPYTGPDRITVPGTVIDGQTIKTNGLEINAPGVVIRNSRIETSVGLGNNGTALIENTDILGDSNWRGGSIMGDDSEDGARGGQPTLTLRKVDVDQGWASVVCINCTIEDSYMHGQLAPAGFETHNNAYWTGGGGSGATLRHNTAFCSPQINNVGGGCSSDIFIGGDFAQPSNYTIDRNLLPASPSASYCLYAGSAQGKQFPHGENIVVTDNVFQRGPNGKCGAYGPVDAWDPNTPGAVWSNNRWDSGEVIPG